MSEDKAKSVVKYWNDWFQASDELNPRSDYREIKPDKSMAQAFIGVRRSGKTSIAVLNALCRKKKASYINFEDPYFTNHKSVEFLDNLATIHKELYGLKPDLLILDEIHNVEQWEKWLRKVVDTKEFQIFVTGSSAKLLSSEIATSLTGRCLETNVWPLSFQEYLEFKKNKKKTSKLFEEYIFEGGFPKVVLEKNPQKRIEILRTYYKDILYKDIVSRYEIRSIAALESMLQYLLTNISSKHSFNSIKRAFGINPSTAHDYAEYCESAFLFFFVKKYDRNLKVQQRNAQKVYCIDTGMRQANAFYHSLDIGKLVENIVFIELKRRGHDIYYHQADYEVDFLLIEGGLPVQAINVCYSDLENEETYDREINGIMEALKQHGLEQGLVLTRSLDTVEIIDRRKLVFKPVYKFMLGECNPADIN